MAFIVPVMKKDYSLYSKKVAPVRSSLSTRCSLKGLEPIKKLEMDRMYDRRRNVSECHLMPPLPDTRHVHFGDCETINYFIYDDGKLVGKGDEMEDLKEVGDANGCDIPNCAPVRTVLRSALRRSYTIAAKPSARASRQSSVRTLWKMTILCSPKN